MVLGGRWMAQLGRILALPRLLGMRPLGRRVGFLGRGLALFRRMMGLPGGTSVQTGEEAGLLRGAASLPGRGVVLLLLRGSTIPPGRGMVLLRLVSLELRGGMSRFGWLCWTANL